MLCYILAIYTKSAYTYPHICIGVVEPYGFIYDKDDKNPEQDVVLNRGRFPTYAPIL